MLLLAHIGNSPRAASVKHLLYCGRMEPRQEIRFALVLYGGASLAIYIHGVTLEFFHLVRATALDASGELLVADSELRETERVYRKLGDMLRARFLVDIASGTSAGGINAIFLGKALANGQSLEQLSQLWLDQADVKDLLNGDKLPRSLLSSRAMYSKLRNAFDRMDSGTTVPLQPEMDVFVTATDIQGLALPIQLTDKTVFEKRHRNVFHLRFGAGVNHFARARNSFLAFVARATSAFPFAFEPMRLNDAGATLAEIDAAKDFFPDYDSQAEGAYPLCAFSDGGCLDNKPFSHAVEALGQRTAELPITRKLMYVEPSPESPLTNSAVAPPDVIENTLAALRLPREETIREDLQRVLERNRLIERVREITSGVEADVAAWTAARPVFAVRAGAEEYGRRTLADEIHDRGPGYAGYHRLKVRAVTDDLAAMLGVAPERVHAWRRSVYSEQDPENSEARFLLEFDLGYRVRRLRFLLRNLSDPTTRRELIRIISTLKPPGLKGEPAAIADYLRPIFVRAAADTEACLDADARRYFDQFDYYDQISFPVLYEAPAGEAELCEVFRISPRDATSIVDENEPGETRKKLAGTALFHFGAFLSREWRANDLQWGRLDGAERIIRSILPRGDVRAEGLIAESHQAIGEPGQPSRSLPLFTRMRLGLSAGAIILRMLAGSYFIRNGQRETK